MCAVFTKFNYSAKIITEIKLILPNKISYNQGEKKKKETEENFD